jgi:hypothetical protein
MMSRSVVSLLFNTNKFISVADEHKGQVGKQNHGNKCEDLVSSSVNKHEGQGRKQNAIEFARFEVLTVVNVVITTI